jgi:alpha-tubulin suppressor-like RCC1 family protein
MRARRNSTNQNQRRLIMSRRTNLKTWLVIIASLLIVQYSVGPQAWAGSIVGWGDQVTPTSELAFITAISTGGNHSLALKADGTIVGWGNNAAGQATPLSGNDFVAVSAGDEHNLAIKPDGTIVGWGDNEYGQATPPSGNDFAAVSAGRFHSLAIKGDGTIAGWGRNDYGQAAPPSGNDFVAISAPIAKIQSYAHGFWGKIQKIQKFLLPACPCMS